jgi:tetratricopeptide (TPR) repeat protein
MKLTIHFLLFSLVGLTSCSEKVDFSNPKSVIEQYLAPDFEQRREFQYYLIADTCKRYITLQDYLKYFRAEDSIPYYSSRVSIKSIEQLDADPNYPDFRRFHVQYFLIDKIENDTTDDDFFITTFLEKGAWKVVWTNSLAVVAEKLENSNQLDAAIEAYEKILGLDPFSAYANRHIGWCLSYKGNSRDALTYAKKAVELSPNYSDNYILLAALYGNLDMLDLSIENLTKALVLDNSESGKATIYSNLSIAHYHLFHYDKANEYANKALAIDSTDTHAWWQKGRIYKQTDQIDSSIFFFKRAVQLNSMTGYLQKQLYYDLAHSLFVKSLNERKNSKIRQDALSDAKKFILEALNIDFENPYYRQLLEDINADSY